MPEGILCIDKPEDFTSFDVVAKVRGMTRCRKIGHGGTLDPMATGVLPLFFGRAVKATSLMPIQDKRYTATVKLGIETDTQDITGTVLKKIQSDVDLESLKNALRPFIGTMLQTPPMYSAVWVDGRRLYDFARKGQEVERPQREITIFHNELLDFSEEKQEFRVDIKCSKGTFIRTICDDIGKSLGCGAVLKSLRRTETLGYGIENCVTLDELQKLCDEGGFEEKLLPADSAFKCYDRVYLSEKQATMFKHGVRLDSDRLKHPDTYDILRVYCGGEFLGLARIDEENGELIIVKLFSLSED